MKISNPVFAALMVSLTVAVVASTAHSAPAGAPPPAAKGDVYCTMKDGTGRVVQEHGPCDLGSGPTGTDKPPGGGGGGNGSLEGCNLAYSAAMRQCVKPIKPTAVEQKAYQACTSNADKTLKTCMSNR